ncbi:unnamed protein product [Schistosoma rodhaini]|uniref:non-specific protein-tyrosine kinase n=1 Tax=Schistosoma rodhaini TaxID=6188 RepID=A0AA85F9R7_9TREM|nr:unnamed protein product [Schistosoma rodhaini]CAH8493818.1 unnamed protein product [Schistosoma rodhaini]
MTERVYYPWAGRCEKLSAFLERAHLRNFYNAIKKKLKINDPNDFDRVKPTDLACLGMTENEINRLVNQLIEDGFSVGNLLSDGYTDYSRSWSDPKPYSAADFHRSKLLRKLFRGKQSYTSAPVSPAHGLEHQCKEQFSIQHSYWSQHQVSFRSTSFSQNNRQNVVTNSAAFTCLIPETDIKLHSRIGIGSFGIVRRGDWTMPTGEIIPVAVKLLKPEAMKSDLFTGFLYEIRAMQCLSHPSLVRLYGIVLSNPIMMVTELAPLGSLLLHLRAQSMCANNNNSCKTNDVRAHFPSVPRALQIDALWDMAIQIVRGMAYLTSQGLVHRDLAARNILISSIPKNEYPQIKIADFGLVRSLESCTVNKKKLTENESDEPIYTGCLEQKIPFAWSAPESLHKRTFSEASDIWSLGVTLWEMWTGGADPWSGLTPVRLLELLDSGRRLVWPRFTCPRRLYQIMLACWRAEPYRRPTFSYLAERLDQIRPTIVIATQNLDEADRLGLEAGDTVIIIDGKPREFWWRGQNTRTGEIGSFPHGIIKLCKNTTQTFDDINQSSLRDSLLHDKQINKNQTESSLLQYNISHTYRDLSSTPTDEKCDKIKTKNQNIFDCSNHNLLPYDDNSLLSGTSFNDMENESVCRTMDSYSSSYGCLFTNSSLSNAPNLDKYDDEDNNNEGQEDERRILDKTPNSTVGLNAYNVELRKCPKSELINSHRKSIANYVANGYNDHEVCSYNPITMLPPPPGPEEHETIICKDDINSKNFSDASVQCTKVKDNVKHLSDEDNLDKSDIGTMSNNHLVEKHNTSSISESITPSKKHSFSLDNLLDEVAYISAKDFDCEPSAPPLIDLYSPVPDPSVFIPRYRITIPTAPIYTPSIIKPTPNSSVFIPRTVSPPNINYLSNPFLQMNYNVSSQLNYNTQNRYFYDPFHPQINMQRPYCTSFPFPSSNFNINQSTKQTNSANFSDNPFNSNNLKIQHSQCINKIDTTFNNLNHETKLDVLDMVFDNNSNNNISYQTPATSSPVFSTKQKVHHCTTRLENELLVRSCPLTNSSETMKSNPSSFNPTNDKFISSVTVSVPENNITPERPQHQVNENQHDLFNSSDNFNDEISLVRSHVPGCTLSEAHWALLHVMNPFSPVISQLIVPPIPCTAPMETWRTKLDRTSAWRVQLAIRLLSVCRLYQLGLINWDSCCQIISSFNWQLEPAADWILDHMTPNCFI